MKNPVLTRYSSHPEDFKKYPTQEIREKFILENIFIPNQLTGVYTLEYSLIVGGIHPTDQPVKLEAIDQLKAEYFLKRREIGIINVGAPTEITADGVSYELGHKEALYRG